MQDQFCAPASVADQSLCYINLPAVQPARPVRRQASVHVILVSTDSTDVANEVRYGEMNAVSPIEAICAPSYKGRVRSVVKPQIRGNRTCAEWPVLRAVLAC